MSQRLAQGTNVVNANGKVKAPPSTDDVLALVAEAVVHKQPLTLNPGEVRVLHDWLVMLEQGNPERLLRIE